jgi:hypothetical protein
MTDTFCFVPTHIIDFGDAFHSDFDPVWDIACLFFTVMRCDGRLLRIFLDEYGMEWSVDVIVARMMGYMVC